MFMKDWKNKLDAFLQFNERDVLNNPGRISNELAKKIALKEYEKIKKKRLGKGTESNNQDFYKVAKKIEGTNVQKKRK